jgi:hypothetical protein
LTWVAPCRKRVSCYMLHVTLVACDVLRATCDRSGWAMYGRLPPMTEEEMTIIDMGPWRHVNSLINISPFSHQSQFNNRATSTLRSLNGTSMLHVTCYTGGV